MQSFQSYYLQAILEENQEIPNKSLFLIHHIPYGQYFDRVLRKEFPMSQYEAAKRLANSYEFGGAVWQTEKGHAVYETLITNEKIKEHARRLLAGERPVLEIKMAKIKPISRLKANSNQLMYDFGGSESINLNPVQPSITDIAIVDKFKPEEIDEDSSNGKNLYYAKANLFAPITLPKPAQEIFVGKLFRYANSPSKTDALIDNIDKHLLKGGILKVFEDSDEDSNRDPFMLDLIKRFQSMGYTLLKTEGYNGGEHEMILLRK